MMGFLHAHTVAGRGRPFTMRDMQVLCLLGVVVSLLIARAAHAEQQSRLIAAAAAGQAVAGLSHDARPILDTLCKNRIGIESGLPGLAENPSWQLVQRDLTFLRHITRDTSRLVRTGKGDLQMELLPLRSAVDDVLDMCVRYYLDETCKGRISLTNACPDSALAFVDRSALYRAVLNCMKNSLRAIGGRPNEKKGMIRILGCDDPGSSGTHYLLSVCDDAGGIPADLLRQLGTPLVQGRDAGGMGLGMHIVVEMLGRMGGQVHIASSTTPIAEFPAGTVISLRLPKTDQAGRGEDDADRQRVVLHHEYARYRAQIESLAL